MYSLLNDLSSKSSLLLQRVLVKPFFYLFRYASGDILELFTSKSVLLAKSQLQDIFISDSSKGEKSAPWSERESFRTPNSIRK